MTTTTIKIRHKKYYQGRKGKERVNRFLIMAILILISICVIFPIWWIFRSSLMTNTELYAYPPSFIPSRWLFSNYIDTLETFKFGLYFGNTMKIIVPAVVGGTLTATLCGYAFARMRFKGRKIIFALCIGSMLLPNMVTLIPQYLMWTRGLHLGKTYLPLILPYLTGGGAFSIFLINQFIRSIPRELDEAATLDGAGHMRILVSIIMPTIKSAMIVVALFIFIQLWNDLLQQTIYINSPENFTIAIGLSLFRSGMKADWAQIMAATCMSFLPGIIIYLVGQRYFIEGIVMTGLKG